LQHRTDANRKVHSSRVGVNYFQFIHRRSEITTEDTDY